MHAKILGDLFPNQWLFNRGVSPIKGNRVIMCMQYDQLSLHFSLSLSILYASISFHIWLCVLDHDILSLSLSLSQTSPKCMPCKQHRRGIPEFFKMELFVGLDTALSLWLITHYLLLEHAHRLCSGMSPLPSLVESPWLIAAWTVLVN